MKETKTIVEVNGKKYAMYFNLNVMEAIQEEYGTLDHWGELTDGKTKAGQECDIKALIFGFLEMLNEGIEIENEKNGTQEPLLTKKQAGRLLTDFGLEAMTDKMNDLVIESAGSEEKNA